MSEKTRVIKIDIDHITGKGKKIINSTYHQKKSDTSNIITPVERIISLQKEIGNFAVGRLISSAGNVILQRQGAPAPAALTDTQQWDQDWTRYPGQQHYFAGNDRPAGTSRHRYDVLCPLYKAHGIPRPMVYMATSITTARFYNFSTPAHNDLATALAAAEGTLKGKGYAAAPVKKVWSLNPRTTSAGGWSNHADGKAVDIDPDENPHLVSKKERKIISLVSGTDMEAGGQSYDVLRGASEKFRADYNLAGLQSRLTRLKADETEKETERNMAKSERDTLKGQMAMLKSERDELRKKLRAVPSGKKATPDDVAKAAELRVSIKQMDSDIGQVQKEIKQKERDLKRKEAQLKEAAKDRDLIEKQLTEYQTMEQAISDLENAIIGLPQEIKSIEDRITQSKQEEQKERDAKNPAGVRAHQMLRAKLQQALTEKKSALKKKEKQLDAKKKQREADPLRKYAAGGFLNLSKDVVEAMTGAGLKWGGSWAGAKDFMHFEL